MMKTSVKMVQAVMLAAGLILGGLVEMVGVAVLGGLIAAYRGGRWLGERLASDQPTLVFAG